MVFAPPSSAIESRRSMKVEQEIDAKKPILIGAASLSVGCKRLPFDGML